MELLGTTHKGGKFHRLKTRVRNRRWDLSPCGCAIDNVRLLDVDEADICITCNTYPGQREFYLGATA